MKNYIQIIAVIFLSISIGNYALAGELGWAEKTSRSISEQDLLELLAKTGTDEDVRAGYKQLVIARFSHEQKALKEREQIIRWTNRASIFIFFLVHVLLIIGAWAAVKEFVAAKRLRKISDQQEEIKISLEGIAFKTSLHGTILFGMTLLLYILFLKFVFPVNLL